jgi:hypothetical protein
MATEADTTLRRLSDRPARQLMNHRSRACSRAFESENAKLKKLLADAMLDNAALKDLLAKKW